MKLDVHAPFLHAGNRGLAKKRGEPEQTALMVLANLIVMMGRHAGASFAYAVGAWTFTGLSGRAN